MENLKQSYEIIMIFSLANGDDSAKALAARFLGMIEENGVVEQVEEWGKRRLAYPIQDELDGYYLMVNFISERDFPTEIERVLNITDGVLRSMTVRWEPAVEEVKEEPAKEVEVPAEEPVAEEPVAEDPAKEAETTEEAAE